MSNTVKNLIAAIHKYSSNNTNAATQLKNIEQLAKEVLHEHQTLDVAYTYSYGTNTSPLSASIYANALEVFQLLIKLGASPFFKFDRTSPSVIEKTAQDNLMFVDRSIYHAPYQWLMNSKDSPILNWASLQNHGALYDQFKAANLLRANADFSNLPMHVAIRNGRMDLVQEVILAAGDVECAGDIAKQSLLHLAIYGVLSETPQAMDILKYLLKHGASIATFSVFDSPAIFSVLEILIVAKVGISETQQQLAIQVIELLLAHGATLDIATCYRNQTPIMMSLIIGSRKLYDFILEKTNSNTLNCTGTNEGSLLFKFLSRDNQLGQVTSRDLDRLKERGVDFSKNTDLTSVSSPFGKKRDLACHATNMTVLHRYVDRIAKTIGLPLLHSLPEHLKIIKTLIAHGAIPTAKATFTKHDSEYLSVELTAAQYFRELTATLMDDDIHDSYIKNYQDEAQLLNAIDYKSPKEQKTIHQKFHEFRNIERALAGKSILPYSGLPKKSNSAPPPAKKNVVLADLDPHNFETQLNHAKDQKNKTDWQAIKKFLVMHVQKSDSLEDFLERVERFKKPLQLHYDSNERTGVNGSLIYRLFHYFDEYRFTSSWEQLQTFAQNKFGVNINTQYGPQTSIYAY